jgi:hypothetical protein
MNGLGLCSRIGRIPKFDRMKEWRNVVEEYLDSDLTNPSIAETSVATSSQNSNLATIPINQDDEGDADDDYRIVTTTLQQIIRDEHNLADIEQQLSFEQSTNHQTFQAFSHILEVVTDMVNFMPLWISYSNLL